MKGPDQVLTIPSGQAISDSIYMGDGEKLNSVIFQEGKKVVSDEDITSVIRYHRKKYAKNTQALRNCIRALTEGLKDIEKFEKPLALEFCEILNLVPDTLREISPNWLAKITNEYLETNSVNRIWKIIDTELKSSLSSESIKNSDNLKWFAECFVAACGQENGLKRSALDEIKLPLDLLTENSVVQVLGDSYPAKYSSNMDILIAVKKYLNESTSEKEETYSSFVSNAFSDCGSEEDIDPILKEITDLWQIKFDSWLVSKNTDESGEKFSNVLYFWPVSNQKAKPYFEQLKNWIVGKIELINKKSSAGFSQDILDNCVAFYMNKIPADGNINGVIHHALAQINSDGLKVLIKRYSNQNSIWEILTPHAGAQIIQAIDRNKFFKEIMISKSPLIKPIASSFASLANKETFLDALTSSETLFEITEEIKVFPNQCSANARVKLLFVFKKYGIDESIVKQTIESFILTPDKSNSAIIDYIQQREPALKLDFTNFSITHLLSNTSNWTEKECEILMWVHIAADEVTDASLKEFIDRAIERGLQSGANETVKKSCTNQILQLWEANQAFTEKSFKILKKSAPSEFDSRVEALAVKNNIQESLLEKAGNVLDTVLGKE